MNQSMLFSKMSAYLTVLIAVGFYSFSANAQIISPSAVEVEYNYTTTFEVPTNANETTDEDRALFHAQHMFGIMHSPTLMEKYEIGSDLGFGAPRSQMNIQILESKTSRSKITITYANSGKMILHKKAAEQILNDGFINLPLPTNPYKIYKKKCTDEHYYTFGDYWYFYDPFKEGCTNLSVAPLATPIDIKIKPAAYKKIETTLKLPYLRGDNGNGNLFSMYVIHGFSDGLTVKDDAGRTNFLELNQYLEDSGFKLTKVKSGTVVPLYVYTKDIELTSGKIIQVEIKHMLVGTAIESKSAAFAKFFKTAVETADVIMYGGHSGLGGNLNIASLEAKAGTFNFNQNKHQLFFFESCSSYSYYLQEFSAQKRKSKIDVITNGLSSYFQTSNAMFTALMDHLLSAESKDQKWIDVLTDMEAPLDGETYLLNVGGI